MKWGTFNSIGFLLFNPVKEAHIWKINDEKSDMSELNFLQF